MHFLRNKTAKNQHTNRTAHLDNCADKEYILLQASNNIYLQALLQGSSGSFQAMVKHHSHNTHKNRAFTLDLAAINMEKHQKVNS